MSARLCSRAPWTDQLLQPALAAACAGTGIDLRPDRYCPVIESLTLRIPFTGPL